ncbi:MAG: hypothetical protein ACYDBQ_11745 [Thermoplasmatota archaeon]
MKAIPAGDDPRDLFRVTIRPRDPRRQTGVEGLTRIQRRFYDFVVQTPGATIQDAATGLGSSHAAATYHLMALGRLGLVEIVRTGRQRRHFPTPGGWSRAAYVAVLLRDPKRAAVVRTLELARQAMTINQVAKGARLPFGLVKRALEQLEALGLVRLERHHYQYRVEATRELRQLVVGPSRPPDAAPETQV